MNPVDMKTPARKSRTESGVQTKKPKKRKKIHRELRPILSGSSSSSTVARPSWLRMGHGWTDAEEAALFREAEELLADNKKLKYYKKSKLLKKSLNTDLADRLNARFPEVAVKFTPGVIKSKVSFFKDRSYGGRPLVTSVSQAPITCSADVLAILLDDETSSASERTNTGATEWSPVGQASGKGKECIGAYSGATESSPVVPVDPYSIKECMRCLESIDELTMGEKVDAIKVLKSEKNREIFINISVPCLRVSWIRSEIDALPKAYVWSEPALPQAGH